MAASGGKVEAVGHYMKAVWREYLDRFLPIETRNAFRLALRRHPYGKRQEWPVLGRIGLPEDSVVVDAGAHAGRFVECVLAYQPFARVLAYEPQPQVYDALSRKLEPFRRVATIQAALGSQEGEQLFTMSDCDQMSSFLDVDPAFLPELAASSRTAQRCLPVHVRTLDDEARRQGLERIRLLKLDVQGYELEVLRGAETILSRVDFIMAEAHFFPIYKGAPLWSDLFSHLSSRGFDLVEMTAFRTDRAGRLMECDMVFRSRSVIRQHAGGQNASDKAGL